MNIKRFAATLGVAAVSATLASPGGMAWAQNRPVTHFTYDANGNLTSTTDAFSRVTSQTYDALNRLKDVTQPKPVGTAPNPVTRFGVDGLDQLTSVTDARSLVTSYAMTGLGNLTQQVSPDTGTTLNTFDAVGNLKTSTDARGKKTTYYYDGIHRLSRALYADGTNSYFYYDENVNGVGRLTRMVDPGVTTRWTYTAQGRVASKGQVLSAGGTARTHTVQYGYNENTGQLTSMTYPSGRIVAFQYGAASKAIETVTVDGQPVASSVTYHPFGGIKSMRLHNGLAWSSTLDQDGRMTSYTLGGVVYSIAWDSANRITAITHATTPYWSRGYAYDGLDRIASFVSEPRDQIFSYDAAGNLLTKTDRVGTNDPVGYTYNISPTSNRMTGIGSMGIGYAVDAAGNRTADSTTTWVVNARGRVSQVRVISGATTYTYNYLINGQNLRVRKTGPSSVVPQGTQVFVYDEAGRLIGEYDNYGRARNEHVWLADRPVALIVYTYSGTSTTPLTTTVYSVEADHLGTPRLITDSTQAQRWSWHSAPYGDTQPNQNPASKGTLVYNLRFPGQYYDKEVNTFYNWHRDYESTTGRYVQSDPIGLAGGLNTYLYVSANPLIGFDATGLVIEYANHPIVVELNHSKLIITPDNQSRYVNDPRFQNVDADGRRFATIGAGPNSAFDLEYGVNRPKDLSEPSTYRQQLDLPCGYADEDEAIDALFALANTYNSNKVRYKPFPQKSPRGAYTGYNSNGFISGLGAAAGFNLPAPGMTGANTPGYQHPVPPYRFSPRSRR